MMNIAIDGPAGAGKSTVARQLARALGYLYVDTGALYRSIGYYAVEHGADPSSEAEVTPLLKDLKVSLRFVEGEQRVFVGEEDVTGFIRTPEMSMAASQVSALPAVRAFLLDLQRDIARENNVVMDGRDIGTTILPDAPVKIFLIASPEERARRRWLELREKGTAVSMEEVLRDVIQRDYNDSHREISPLSQAEDAVLVDTTGCDREQALEKLLTVVHNAQEKISN